MILDCFDIESEYYKEMMNIIIYSKLNKPEKGYIHHIIPKCYYKHYNMEIDNSISNTVLLTWENHKKVHNLAYKCAKEPWLRSKLAFACHYFGDNEPNITFTEEHRQKISEAQKGKKQSKETVQKRMLKIKNIKHKPVTEETKKKISETTKIAMKNVDKEKLRFWKGKKRSNDFKKKRSEIMKKYWENYRKEKNFV